MSATDLPSPQQPLLLNGKHTVVVEEDLIKVRFVGTYEPDEARTLLGIVQRVRSQHVRMFLLVDLSQTTKPPGPATRRVLAEWKPQAEVYTAYVGASWVMRSVSILIHSAMRLVSHKPVLAHFVNTESEALAWIAQQRESSVRST